jgi:hypothetical protein
MAEVIYKKLYGFGSERINGQVLKGEEYVRIQKRCTVDSGMEMGKNPQQLLSEELTLTHFLILLTIFFQRLGLEVEDEKLEEKLDAHVTIQQLP